MEIPSFHFKNIHVLSEYVVTKNQLNESFYNMKKTAQTKYKEMSLHINIHKIGHIYSKFLSTYIKYKNYFHFEKCTSHFISLNKQN